MAVCEKSNTPGVAKDEYKAVEPYKIHSIGNGITAMTSLGCAL